MEPHLATRLARAHSYVELGRWQAATTELGLVLAGEPRSAEALCLLAQCRLQLRDDDEARRAAESALAVAPDDEWAHRLRSLALQRLGRHHEATVAAWEAVRLAPQVADTHARYAAALLQLGAPPDEARAAADRAVALAPHSPGAHVVQGVAAGRQGRVVEERDAYRRALELDPTDATALSNLAAVDANRGRLGGAARFLTAALRNDPHHQSALALLDVVGVRLLRRLTVVTVMGGLVAAFLALAQRDGAGGTSWMRGLAGLATLATCALVARATLRHLPTGAHRHLRGLPRRLSWFDRLVGLGLCLAVVSMLGAAFLPVDAAATAAVGVLLVLRLGWVAAAVGAVRWLRANARR
jgi:Tfp pilus assembly protein PilF